MLNHIDLQGRFVADPELRTTTTGVPVTTFTLAVERDHNRGEADFISCVAFKGTAEFISKYFVKGQLALVSGSLQTRKWKDKDGKSRTNWDVVAQNCYFCGGKSNTEPKIDVIPDDDEEIPF